MSEKEKKAWLISIGNRVAKKRQEMGLTQEQFADKYSYARTTIAKLEAGLRDFKSTEIVELAKILNVSTDYLLGKDRGKTPEINEIVEKTGLTPTAVEILSKWAAWADAGEVSSVNKETIQARQKILSFLIKHEEAILKGEGEPVGLLSYLYCRLFANLYFPLFRSNDAIEKELHERALALKESKGRELTAAEKTALTFEILDYDMILEAVPLVLAGGNKRLHKAILDSKELSKIYDSGIIEALGKLRKIAENKEKNGKHNKTHK